VTEKIQAEKIICYTDESGNTGLNIFDEQQPFFWTGTIFSKHNLDTSCHKNIKDYCSKLNVEELHGNEIGLNNISKISTSLTELFNKYGCRFIFTRVEKEHVASTKFFDQIFDPGLNRAMPSHIYWFRPLRLVLAAQVIKNLDLQMKKDFWKAWQIGDDAKLTNVLYELRRRVWWNVSDKRVKQIILEVINVALINPKSFISGGLDPENAPNLVSISMIIKALREIYRGGEFEISEFVHDEQNQFARGLKLFYELHSKIELNLFQLGKITEAEVSRVNLVTRPSSNSPGLQFIDIVLWLTKRIVENNHDLPEELTELIHCLMSKMHIEHFTQDQFYFDAQECHDATMSLPMPPEKCLEAQRILAELEDGRNKRLGGFG